MARKIQFACDKTFAIEAIDEGLMIAFRVHTKLARSGFHNGADNPTTQSVRLGVSCESTPRHFDRAAGCADPEVAVTVFGQCPYSGVSQFFAAQGHAYSSTTAAGVREQFGQPAIGAYPDSSICRFIQRYYPNTAETVFGRILAGNDGAAHAGVGNQ